MQDSQARACYQNTRLFFCSSSTELVSYLGLVPLLGLLEVLGSHAFVLLTNVTQGSCEVRLRNIHVDLDVLFLDLGLQLLDFLKEEQS